MPDPKRRLSFNPFSWGSHDENNASEDPESTGRDNTVKGPNDDEFEKDIDVSDTHLKVKGGDDANNLQEKELHSTDDDTHQHGHLEHGGSINSTSRHHTFPESSEKSGDNPQDNTTDGSEEGGKHSGWRFTRRHTMEPSRAAKQNSSPARPPERPQSIEFELPPLDPVTLIGYNENTKSRLMTESLSTELRDLLPERLQLYSTWKLSYSLEQHGASLHTLYSNVVPKPQKRPGYLLVVKDKKGDIFGAYANEYFHTTESRRFYGNGECFLWKTSRLPNGDIRFQAFPYTGVNDFVIFCAPNFLSMGGGDGHYGLWLDDNLEHGVSSRTTTFGNEVLSSEPNFYVVALEVWCIGPS
ncbi:Oxr1p [Sugiyamaella lignohabitans]|uniref:Oxidation resistance protein 1 n=1 Tax=Sugiyamaella lignohabitans TaxID=796027 RepID=A0A167EFQ0_9ASCO|nr:Oxr1p [Sugiyamaella lignohabitans]ANB14023.1 Oxr1p [Sugiyamaella lignohabitans]